MKYEDEDWIATRSVIDETGMHAGIVRLSRPRLLADVWSCTFSFETNIGAPVVGVAHGSDAFQAILNGLAGIRSLLKERPNLTWVGGYGTGFPATLPYGLGAELHDRLELLVNAEVAAHVDELRAKHAPR